VACHGCEEGKELVFCQRRRCEEIGLGSVGGTFFPLSFLNTMFFKTNIQVLPLGEENAVRILKMHFQEGLLAGLWQ
jgi:hypothetical protein